MGEFLHFGVGAVVHARNSKFQVEQLLSLDEFVGVNLETRKREILSTGELELIVPGEERPLTRPDVYGVSNEDWKIAEEEFFALQPLLTNPNRTRSDVIAFAAKHGSSPATIYRHIRNARALDSPLGLVRRTRLERPYLEFKQLIDGAPVQTLEEAVLTYAKDLIEQGKRSSDAEFCRKVVDKLKKLKWPHVPHINTVRLTMLRLSPKILMTIRKGRKAGLTLDPLRGEYSEQHRPYQVFQIDHTPLNVIVVDEEHREPIGRGVITVVLEIGCRVVPGFAVSLDAPSTESISAAIRHAVLRKEQWLRERGIKASWPIFGKAVSIHADNANEFRGDVLKRVCASWDMNLIWRPVAHPQYGAHIERFMGTLATILEDLSGTTFSNVVQKADYDSEGNALMTLDELEVWLVHRIAGVYHNRKHSGLGDVAPIIALQRALDGTDDKPGIGRPPLVTDERRLYLDFLPREERVVSRQGVLIDGVHYRADYLTPLIGTKDPEDPKKSKLYSFAQDRRQISPIHYFDQSINDYIEVPYANPSRPQTSWWELKAARERVAANGGNADNEDEVFRSLEESKAVEEASRAKTKKVRREAEKRRQRERSKKFDDPSKLPGPKPNQPESTPTSKKDDDDGELTIAEVEDM